MKKQEMWFLDYQDKDLPKSIKAAVRDIARFYEWDNDGFHLETLDSFYDALDSESVDLDQPTREAFHSLIIYLEEQGVDTGEAILVSYWY